MYSCNLTSNYIKISNQTCFEVKLLYFFDEQVVVNSGCLVSLIVFFENFSGHKIFDFIYKIPPKILIFFIFFKI